MYDHVRYRKRSPENSRTGAQAYELTLRQKLARGEPITSNAQKETDQEKLFERFAWKWFETYVVPNNKYSEQRTKKYILSASLVPYFGAMAIDSITTMHIEQYKAQLIKEANVTPKTINNRLTVLHKCLHTAYEWYGFDGRPPEIKWLKCPPSKTDYLSFQECELLLSCSEGVVRELILMALRTGMRQGELRGLQWSSIDWHNRNIIVRHSRDDYRKTLGSPKSNRERVIPLDVDLYEMIYRRKKATGYVFLDVDEQPFDNKRLSRRLARVCKKAGIRKIGWHTLRHTFATQLSMLGTPLNTVQTLLGHSTIATTMRYAHTAPSTLRCAIDMLNPKTAVNADLRQPVVNQWSDMQRYALAKKTAAPKNL